MSFFKKALGAGSMFKKQVMPNVQGFFKKGGGGRQFSKMAGEAAGLAGVASRELRRGANNPVLEQIGNMTVGADRTRQLRAGALAGSAALGGGFGRVTRCERPHQPQKLERQRRASGGERFRAQQKPETRHAGSLCVNK